MALVTSDCAPICFEELKRRQLAGIHCIHWPCSGLVNREGGFHWSFAVDAALLDLAHARLCSAG